jgi:hypothetical protein
MSVTSVKHYLPSLKKNISARHHLQVQLKTVKHEAAAGGSVSALVPASRIAMNLGELLSFEDERTSKALAILSHSMDAKRLSLNTNGKLNMNFMSHFNASLYNFARCNLKDIGIDHVSVTVDSKSLAPKVDDEVTKDMRFIFNGTISATPSVGSIELFTAWGIKYYINGADFKHTSAEMLYVAWCAPVVADKDATFALAETAMYFNFPSALASNLQVDPVTNAAFADDEVKKNCSVHVEPIGPENDADGIFIFWKVMVPTLVPKPQVVGQRGIPITRPQVIVRTA